MAEWIEVDGSRGEGGGQIVRSSLALSLVTGRAVAIENIRAGRKKPGLLQQHLTAVKAAATISGGNVTGATLGSTSVRLEPGNVRAGEYCFKVGTAGSAALVLQTILPALLIADAPSTATLEGGTHNDWSPPFDFLQRGFLPLVERMGPRITATLERYGFYPAGGGRFTVQIVPAGRLDPIDLAERGEVVSQSVTAYVSRLPRHVGEREIGTILRELQWEPECGNVDEVTAFGPGNVVAATIVGRHVTEVFTAFGRAGLPAERVAMDVVRQITDYMRADVPVGPYLADQILLPMGISAWQSGNDSQPGGGRFRTLELTQHTTTHIEILQKFLDIDVRVEPSRVGSFEVTLAPGK